MITPKNLLGHVSGGRVLDVATGGGGFVGFLLEGLKDYTEIVGIDTSERGMDAFAESFKDKPNVHFVKMDAARMDFPDGSFDTVCISNSLHHLSDLKATLSEMMRVLRHGGYLILLEMFCDGQTETQLTHVHLHHWWAAVDRTQHIIHEETHTRQQVMDIVTEMGLQDLVVHDLSETDSDPKDPEVAKQLEDVINRYIQRADGRPDLQQRGEELRKRLQEVGFHSAASLLFIGRKEKDLI